MKVRFTNKITLIIAWRTNKYKKRINEIGIVRVAKNIE